MCEMEYGLDNIDPQLLDPGMSLLDGILVEMPILQLRATVIDTLTGFLLLAMEICRITSYFPTVNTPKAVAKDPSCMGDVCTDQCNLTLFDPKDYPSMVFLYRESSKYEQMKLVSENVLLYNVKRTHFDFGEYIVLCQTVQHPNIIDVPEYAQSLPIDCNGNRGFGKWKCSAKTKDTMSTLWKDNETIVTMFTCDGVF